MGPGGEIRLKDSRRESTAVPEFVVYVHCESVNITRIKIGLSLSEDRLTGSLRSTGKDKDEWGLCWTRLLDYELRKDNKYLE